MCSSWIAMILSIVICGLAICSIAVAGGEAVYNGRSERAADIAYVLLLISGGAFVLALFALVAAAILSLNHGSATDAGGTATPPSPTS